MRALSAADISLAPAAPAAGSRVAQSRLVAGSGPTQTVLDGVVLEAAFQWRDAYLLFVTDDMPHEDMLRITLLDARFQALDAAVLGALYATGSFRLLGTARDAVRFRFFGGTDWCVEMLPGPRWRLPWRPDPRGVARPFGLARRFVVRGDPQPEPRR